MTYNIQLESFYPDGVWAFLNRTRSARQMQKELGEFPKTLSFHLPNMPDALVHVWRHSTESLALRPLFATSWAILTRGEIPLTEAQITSNVDPIEAPDNLVRWLKVHVDNSSFPSEQLKQTLKIFGVTDVKEFVEMRKCFLCMEPSVNFAMRSESDYKSCGYDKPMTWFFGVCTKHSDDRDDAYQQQATDTISKLYHN